MLSEGRIGLEEAESKAVDKLMGENEGKPVAMTRRDPGETGPLIVDVDGVEYEIAADGKRKKLK